MSDTVPDLPGEIWRGVIGLEDAYQVSNWGRVRSLDRYIEGANGRKQRIRGGLMRAQRAGNKRTRPYLHVCLRWRGERIGVFVHQLVAWAFLGEQPAGHHIHHKNGDSMDNRACNLEYRQHAEHLSEHHTGERNPAAILTAHQVQAIRRQLAAGANGAALGREYGVSKTTIYAIRDRRTWADVEELAF